MSYSLLSSLYFGEGSNADLSSPEARALLHVSTPLDTYIPSVVARGLDVILTGNPGDGKSHIVRTLLDRDRLKGAEVELDLSATPTSEVLERWTMAAAHRRPFVLCANEGPLVALLEVMSQEAALAGRAGELRRQLGHLVAPRKTELPAEPKHAVLIDLADRSVLDVELIERALHRVCDQRLLPRCGARSTETSAGRNLMLFAESEVARRRLAQLLVSAGRTLDKKHISFRQLWQAIAFAITGGKKESTLTTELSLGKVGLGTFPLDNLVKGNGRGLLVDAMRGHGDPRLITDPILDEEIWSTGSPGEGRWLFDAPPVEVPARLWATGDHERALEVHGGLKRLVALAHEAGERIVQRAGVHAETPAGRADGPLRRDVLEGIRRLYVSPTHEAGAADWLLAGLPLWIGHTYRDEPASRRPHISVSAIPEHSFEVLRPHRAPWLEGALGPLPEIAWLSHMDSGISLRLDSDLLGTLTLARSSSGPMSPPEVVQRFLSRLAGWEESRAELMLDGDTFAVLKHPRGSIVVTGATRELTAGGFSYV
jgi:hypothetical protein